MWDYIFDILSHPFLFLFLFLFLSFFLLTEEPLMQLEEDLLFNLVLIFFDNDQYFLFIYL